MTAGWMPRVGDRVRITVLLEHSGAEYLTGTVHEARPGKQTVWVRVDRLPPEIALEFALGELEPLEGG